MMSISHIVYEVVVWLFLTYSAMLFIIYAWVGVYAFGALKRYRRLNQFTDYKLIATNPNVPAFSIIAPAYNEGMTIVDNVRSLLSLYYYNLEIIIVNDGSKDDSMAKLIQAYDLQKTAFFVQGTIPTNTIKGVYKSKNPAFKKLIVVDKVNGGKADALNVGINISAGQYIVAIDVDCILEQDALLKLAKPFLDQTEERVIACGGVIRLANNCTIENGKVVDVNLPKTWLGRFQALEYIRAFVLGRMAWSRASGLILISGAFGAFDKEIVLACGGYDRETVGEDMELVVRMRRYMEEQRAKYKVVNIPDPLCWTEVPESKDILKKQRNRWMRGTMETLWKHRKLMFNPKYGKLGMVSIPYWFFFEFLGPLVEFFGYLVFILFLVLGIINWSFFWVLLVLVLASGILYSIYSILVDLLTDQVYTKGKDLATLILTAVLEPFFFHVTVVRAGVSGVVDYFRKQHGWGEMTRQGFQQHSQDISVGARVLHFFNWGLGQYAPIALTFISLFCVTVALEIGWYSIQFDEQLLFYDYLSLFIDNISFALQLTAALGLLFIILIHVHVQATKGVLILLFTFVLVMQFVLFLYFGSSQNLLGADLFFYSFSELQHILVTSGMLSIVNIGALIFVLAVVLVPLWLAAKKQYQHLYAGLLVILLGLVSSVMPLHLWLSDARQQEFTQQARGSKWRFFMTSNFQNYLDKHPEVASLWLPAEDPATAVLGDYAFMRAEDTKDLLGTYMKQTAKTPNLVFLIVEGLGHAYSSADGYIGNFTPFVDSLRQESLSWSNAFSSSGRTFSVLPTMLGSLPFAANGFLEQQQYPQHFTLWNVLQKNAFKTGFFYGGDASFDFMQKFIEFNKVDVLVQESSFESSYQKLPAKGGESWGFEDQAVLDKMLQTTPVNDQPYFNVLLTLSTHSPFLINRKGYYDQRVDERIKLLNLKGAQRNAALQYKDQLASVMNLDDALRGFFDTYKQRPDYANTIFVITGDHSMSEIALENKIDRYHVPLLIYSPLLNGGSSFEQIVSHYDIAPTVLAYYREQHGLATPDTVGWVGRGLQVGAASNSGGVPIMQSKYQQDDFVLGRYHLVKDALFSLEKNGATEITNDKSALEMMQRKFNVYKEKNRQFITTQELLPERIFQKFFGNE